MHQLLLIILISLGLSACTSLNRDPRSGYSGDYNPSEPTTKRFYKEQALHKVFNVKKELGYSNERPLTDSERNRLRYRLRLKKLEEQIDSSTARRQYYKFKPYLPTDAEKIYFLSLPTEESRLRWAQSRGYTDNAAFPEAVNKVIEEGDVVLGMTKKAVLESWGDPDLVEVAGNPEYGNERWQYKKIISSTDGFNNELRIIYFEGGQVAGWEKF